MSCFGKCFGGTSKKEIPAEMNSLEKKSIDRRRRRVSVLSAFKKSETLLSKTKDSQNGEKIYASRNSVNQSALDSQMKIKLWENLDNSSQSKLNKSSGKIADSKPHWEYKDKIRCLFCGGTNCKHENYLLHKNPAIIGLHSDYITSDIIASQRPSTVLIKKFELIKKFKEHNIGLIVNLQREGEHPFCGPNADLEKQSGFSYDPQDFVSEDIKFRPSGWKDMSVPDSMNFILEIVKDMAVTIKEMKSKVLVHCHAGYGRTGVVIACYMLFDSNLNTEDIIKILRKKRPGCVQKDTQYSFCEKFKKFIHNARVVFPNAKINIEQLMKNQKDILYGTESIKFEYIPKIVAIVLEKLLELIKAKKLSKSDLWKLMNTSDDWDDKQEDLLHQVKIDLNKNQWHSLYKLEDSAVIIQLLYDWLEDCVAYIINPEKIDMIFKRNHIGDLIKKHVEDPRSFSSENRKSLYESLKSIFRTLEIETLNCIAHFVSQVKPDNETQKDNYRSMIISICFHLLGFDLTSIQKYIDVDEAAFYNYYVNCLAEVVNFLVIVTEYDIEDDESNWMSEFSPYVFNRKISMNSLKDFPMKKISQLFKNGMKKSSTVNDLLKANNFIGSPEKYDTPNKTLMDDTKENMIESNFSNFANIFNLNKCEKEDFKGEELPDKEFFKEIYNILDDFYKQKGNSERPVEIQSPTKNRFGSFVNHLQKLVTHEGEKETKKTAVFSNLQFNDIQEELGRESSKVMKFMSGDSGSIINLKKISNDDVETLKSSSLNNTFKMPPFQMNTELGHAPLNLDNDLEIYGIKLKKKHQTLKAINKNSQLNGNIQEILNSDNKKMLRLTSLHFRKDDDLYNGDADQTSDQSRNIVETVMKTNINSTIFDHPNCSTFVNKNIETSIEIGNQKNKIKAFDKSITFENNLKESVEYREIKSSVFRK